MQKWVSYHQWINYPVEVELNRVHMRNRELRVMSLLDRIYPSLSQTDWQWFQICIVLSTKIANQIIVRYETRLMSLDDNSKVLFRDDKTLLSKFEVEFVSKLSLTVHSIGWAGSVCRVIPVLVIYLKIFNKYINIDNDLLLSKLHMITYRAIMTLKRKLTLLPTSFTEFVSDMSILKDRYGYCLAKMMFLTVADKLRKSNLPCWQIKIECVISINVQ